MCVPLRLHELIIENDSILLVSELQQDHVYLAFLGNIITEIKDLMKRFRICTVQHIGRNGTEATHRLVRHAWHVDDILVWWNSFPGCISQIIWFDKQF